MSNLTTLKRQHNDILNLVETIENNIQQEHLENNARLIAKGINELSGKLKIHLSHEDRYLYPSFKKSNNIELKNKANNYIEEMGNLSSIYSDFKNNYNTPTKIIKNQDNLVKKSKIVMGAIKERIKQEDHDLYKLAEKL